ncbi:MAG: hypothetical protein QGF23_00560 [Dehalococcoidales bacterium]|jgi:hypothetical protein|nr:hypothetical protein [Dehalococcoidales bacterium]
MNAKMRWLKIGVNLIVILSLAIVLVVPSPVVLATVSEVGTGGIPLSINDFSVVPQHIVDDANMLATELFGDAREKHQDFISQLQATYLMAKDKDIVIIFNSGGWGWTPIEDSPFGMGIVTGISSELASLGYTTLFLNHLRTYESWQVIINESVEIATRYPSKAKDLVTRVKFLTNHIPDLRVIIAGESEGSLICTSVMSILSDNPQLYSIQMGPPFWNSNTVSGKSLVLRSNGEVADAFSQGDIFAIIRANLEAMFGISQENAGKILFYIGAPGHDYRWEYPEVRSQITKFLYESFGIKQ